TGQTAIANQDLDPEQDGRPRQREGVDELDMAIEGVGKALLEARLEKRAAQRALEAHALERHCLTRARLKPCRLLLHHDSPACRSFLFVFAGSTCEAPSSSPCTALKAVITPWMNCLTASGLSPARCGSMTTSMPSATIRWLH